MKRSLLTTTLILVAGVALADPPNYASIEDYKKVEPVVQYCWSTDHFEPCPVGDVSGSLDASLQCIAPAANTKAAYSAVSGSSTAVDAGCTANALWLKATNLSRTYDVRFTTPDGGSGRIPPSGTEFICKSGSATPDNLTFDSTCDTCNTGRVSITAGCAS